MTQDLAETVQSPEAKILASALHGLRDDISELKVNVRGMTESLEALVRLQVEHGETRRSLERAFIGLERLEQRSTEAHEKSVRQRKELDDRMRTIERELPSLREGRKWLVGIASVCLVMLLTALVASVLIPRYPPNIEFIRPPK